jgi:uncharacterized membrane protein SpoIIM required for sporulation
VFARQLDCTDPASPEGAGAFARRYQALARDLAVARSRGYSRRLVARLNDLVLRGHNRIYERRVGYGAAVRTFLLAGFPRRVRLAWRFVLASGLLFSAPLVGMAVTVLVSPEWVYSVMSAEQAAELEAMYDPTASVIGRERTSDSDFAMFGFYVMNNVGISFQLFASGLLLGLGSAFYLVFNGLHIGAAAGHMVNSGFTETFSGFVAGHGPFELTAIVISGAAGLMLGYGLLAPGRESRSASLQRAAREAVPLVLGAALMLLVAAFVEAFWSSISAIAVPIKHAVGAALWLLVLAYLVSAGRDGNALGVGGRSAADGTADR